ncbi:MAG: hypothetical protein R2849_13880 [Thermomicrobiales bacterium]
MAERAELIGAMEYRCIGPHRGGRVVAVSGDPVNKSTFYFGSTGGGVWKTTDGGVSWRNVSDGYFEWASVGALAVAPSDPNVIYAGMGETSIRGNVSRGDGVYKSTDAGQTWKHMGLAETQNIGEICIHPENPDLVYLAALGHVWGPNAERGVYRSKDGGQNWELVLHKSSTAGAVDLAMDPKNPRILYAAIWEGSRRTALPVVRRQRIRYVDVDRCRGQLERDHPQPWPAAGRGHRQDRVRPPARRPGGSTPSSRPRMARSSARTTTARPGRGAARTATCASAPGTTTDIYADPERPRHGLRPERQHVEVNRRRQELRVDFRPARRHPRSLDRPGGFQPDDSR